MRAYETQLIDGKIYVENFPKPEKTFDGIDPNLARKLADYALHRHDLLFARQCLEAMSIDYPELVLEALWRNAIIHYCKCFSRASARINLQEGQILNSQPPEAMKVHRYFMKLRNKHIAHDENAYLDAKPGFIFPLPGEPGKIEDVLCAVMRGNTRDQVHVPQLNQLVDVTLRWVNSKMEEAFTQVRQKLESETDDVLASQPDVTYSLPTADDLYGTRTIIGGKEH